MRKKLSQLWGWVRQILSARSLLDVIGVKVWLVGALSSLAGLIWGNFQHLSALNQYGLLLILITCSTVLWKARSIGKSQSISPRRQITKITIAHSFIYSGSWSNAEFERPQVFDVTNIDKNNRPIKNVSARIRYEIADGSGFTSTEAPWLLKTTDDAGYNHNGIASRVDLKANEPQSVVLLMARKDGTVWAYSGKMSDPVGMCDVGHWIITVLLQADNYDPVQWRIGLTVMPDQTIRYDDPAFLEISLAV